MATETSEKLISFDDFLKVNLRVGTIIAAKINEKARKPAYILTIDFGEMGVKTSSAQITEHYTPTDLIGTQIVAVTNFSTKLIAGVKSEVLVLGAISPETGVILLRPSLPAPDGAVIG